MKTPVLSNLSPPFTAHELCDFSVRGFLRIITRLEEISHHTAWAREALNAERRAYLIIHGGMQAYSPSELSSPIRSFGGSSYAV